MFTAEEQAWSGDDLHDEIQIANVEDFRSDRQERIVEIAIRDVDLPWEVPLGHIVVRGTSTQLREAIGEALFAIKCCMEAGVPAEGRSALPPSRIRRSVSSALVALACVVRGSRVP